MQIFQKRNMWCCYYNNKLFKFKTVEALKEFFNVDLPEERPVDIGDSDSEKEMEVSE